MCTCGRVAWLKLRDAKRAFRENCYPPSEAALWAEVEYWQGRVGAPCRCA